MVVLVYVCVSGIYVVCTHVCGETRGRCWVTCSTISTFGAGFFIELGTRLEVRKPQAPSAPTCHSHC